MIMEIQMKSSDLPDELVDIMIKPWFNRGWEYIYWGKKIILEKETKREEFLDYVLEELNAKDYDFTSEDIEFPLDCDYLEENYYAFLYMDEHDGDHYGIVIYCEEEVEQWIKDKAGKIMKLLDITNEN